MNTGSRMVVFQSRFRVLYGLRDKLLGFVGSLLSIAVLVSAGRSSNVFLAGFHPDPCRTGTQHAQLGGCGQR